MLNIHFPVPPVGEAEAEAIALEYYGVKAVAKALPGEKDKNFYLRDENGREYVLKVANESEKYDNWDMENQALRHLERQVPDLNLQRVCATLNGEDLISVKLAANNTQHWTRLLSWIPGQLWAHVNPHTPALWDQLGQALGLINKGFQGFEHPSAHRVLRWDITQVAWIEDYQSYVRSEEQRSLIRYFYHLYQQEVNPRLPLLRKAVIYNDANDYNVCVQANGKVCPFDFGDMVYGPVVADLAVALAYVLMDKPDPLAAASAVIAGFHRVFPLTEDEIRVLFPMITARLIISVTNSAFQQHAEPDNAYLLISEKPAWALLERLRQIPPALAHYTFRQACGWIPCPATPAIETWLKKHAASFAPVMGSGFDPAKTIVFDLSIGSADLGNVSNFETVEPFDELLSRLMQQRGAASGIGRYNECRPIYRGDDYLVDTNEGPEWRTCHIGLDIFMPAGSPVYAPFDGIVHDFRFNDAPYDFGPLIILAHNPEPGIHFYTLYGHLSLDSLDGLEKGRPVAKGEAFAALGNFPENGNWPPHLHLQIMADLLDKGCDFPGVARPSERRLWTSICPDPNLIVQVPEARFKELPALPDQSEVLKARHSALGPNLSLSYQQPLYILRGWRQHLYDVDGRAYLDTVNNVCHVGHCHPRVVEAASRQLGILNTNTRYLHPNIVQLASLLTQKLPEPLEVCFFVNSGSEANELALRLARNYTGQFDTIVLEVGYHGNTQACIEASSYKFDGPGGKGAMPYIHKVPLPDPYRGIHSDATEAEKGSLYAAYVKDAVSAIQNKGNGRATFLAESIVSCGGQVEPPADYFQKAYQYVKDAGGICIADEVQTGIGRVGNHFWAFENYGVTPDIVTIGKPFGNGFPLGAVVTTRAVADAFVTGMEYFNTFGGNPVACAVGAAVLQIVEQEGLQQNALETGLYLRQGLAYLQQKYPIIGDIRGPGLFTGFELVNDPLRKTPAAAQASYLANRMRERAVLMSTDGPDHNVLKIKPPIIFNQSDADFLITQMDAVFKENGMQQA